MSGPHDVVGQAVIPGPDGTPAGVREVTRVQAAGVRVAMTMALAVEQPAMLNSLADGLKQVPDEVYGELIHHAFFTLLTTAVGPLLAALGPEAERYRETFRALAIEYAAVEAASGRTS